MMSRFCLMMLLGLFWSCQSDDDAGPDPGPMEATCETLSIDFRTDIPVGWEQQAANIHGTTPLLLRDDRMVLAAHFQPNLILLDNTGSVQWEHTFMIDDAPDTVIDDIIETPDGDLILTGWRGDGNYGYRLGFIAKIDLEKNVQWVVSLSDQLYVNKTNIIATQDGRYVVTTDESSGFDPEAYIRKIDGDGNQIWQTSYSAGFGTSDIVETSAGQFILISAITVTGLSIQLKLTQLSANGQLTNVHLFGNRSPENPTGLVRVSDTDVIVSGFINEEEMLMRLSVRGDSLWRVINNNPLTERDRIYSITEGLNDEEFLYAAYQEDPPIGSFTQIGKVSADGVASEFDFTLPNLRVNSIKKTNDGYLVSGYGDPFGQFQTISLVKLQCN